MRIDTCCLKICVSERLRDERYRRAVVDRMTCNMSIESGGTYAVIQISCRQYFRSYSAKAKAHHQNRRTIFDKAAIKVVSMVPNLLNDATACMKIYLKETDAPNPADRDTAQRIIEEIITNDVLTRGSFCLEG